MGKFLAAFGVYFIANTLALLPAITMGFFSSAFPWGILFGNYIGTLLYGAAMISIGVFISGLTISQVIAAIGTFVIAIFLMFVDQIASRSPATSSAPSSHGSRSPRDMIPSRRAYSAFQAACTSSAWRLCLCS